MQCNAMQDYTSQHYTSQDHTNQLTGTAQQLQLLQIYIIADHMQILVFTLKTTSKTATRTASSSCSFEKIPLHLIPFSLILLELKAHCSGYVVFKTLANVFSFLDKNSLIKLSCSSRAAIVKFQFYEKKRGESIFDFSHLKTAFRTKFVLLLFWKMENKICFKIRFRLPRTRKTVGPLINLKYMLILFSKLFSKIEKRKTEIDY